MDCARHHDRHTIKSHFNKIYWNAAVKVSHFSIRQSIPNDPLTIRRLANIWVWWTKLTGKSPIEIWLKFGMNANDGFSEKNFGQRRPLRPMASRIVCFWNVHRFHSASLRTFHARPHSPHSSRLSDWAHWIRFFFIANNGNRIIHASTQR